MSNVVNDDRVEGGVTGRPSLREQRRKQILKAYEECVLEYGWEGATDTRIAAQAGLNRNLIRHYYGGREALTQALIDRVLRDTLAQMQEALSHGESLEDAEAVIDFLTGPSWPDERDDALIDAAMAAMHRDPRLRGQQKTKYETYLEWVEQALTKRWGSAQRQDIKMAAYVLMCIAVGNAAMYDVGLERDASQAARTLVASLLESPTVT